MGRLSFNSLTLMFSFDFLYSLGFDLDFHLFSRVQHATHSHLLPQGSNVRISMDLIKVLLISISEY